jgi:hypothetical protein
MVSAHGASGLAGRRGIVNGRGWLPWWLRPSERARRRSLKAFQADVRSACAAREVGAIDRLERRRVELDLAEDEVAIEVEMIEALRDLADLTTTVEDEGLPVVETSHRAVGAEICHLVVPMSLPDSETQASGKLFLTDRRIVWVAGASKSAVSWSGAGLVRREDRDLVIVSADRQRVYRFRCNSYSEAIRAAFIAEWYLARGRRGAGQPL